MAVRRTDVAGYRAHALSPAGEVLTVRFRPCIDLHQGKVKQIVGSTLSDGSAAALVTNFEAEKPASHFADLYRRDGLEGGHVIMLGPGNEAAAESALAAYPGGLQIGGGIRPHNAAAWLAKGAAKVIVTSFLFADGRFSWERLEEMAAAAGRDRLVIDLSCRRVGNVYLVAADRWQTVTDLAIDAANLTRLAAWCSEFLIHAVDVEGKQRGIDKDLAERLGEWSPLPTTYAGGVCSTADLECLERLGRGRLDATVGSALDLFGGTGLRYVDLVAFDRARRPAA